MWSKGALDEWFNDFYFRHVAQTAIRMFQPTHVVLLGDLLSTQNLDDAEFDERVRRLKSSFQPTSPVFDGMNYRPTSTDPHYVITGPRDISCGKP